MRIELRDQVGYSRMISTQNSGLAAAWLAEWLPQLMSANTAMGYSTLMIYPDTDEEMKQLKLGSGYGRVLDRDGLKQISRIFHSAAYPSDKEKAAHGSNPGGFRHAD